MASTIAVMVCTLGVCPHTPVAMRWNVEYLGISDYVALIFTDVVFGAISAAFSTLPIMALFAKITPRRIEGTMFAFLTGTSNFDTGVMQPAVGSFINAQFVGVNKDDLSGYPNLMLISFICSFIGFALLPLIPLQEDLDEAAAIREEQAKKEAQERQDRREARDAKREENRRAGQSQRSRRN